MSPRKLQPALLAGVFIGAFSALPVVSIGNLCCCLWLVAGGVLAAWLMQQSHPAPVSPFDGAAVGLLAGLVGALAYVVIAWPVTLVVGPMMEEWLQRVVEGAGDVPWRDVLERYQGRGALAVSLIVGFLLQLVFGAIFATLGGVLGAMLFKKTPPLPPPPSFEPPAGPWTPPPPPPPLPGPSSEPQP